MNRIVTFKHVCCAASLMPFFSLSKNAQNTEHKTNKCTLSFFEGGGCKSSCQSHFYISKLPLPVPLHCPAVSRSHSIPSWAAAVFPGSLISMALQLRISVAWLPIHRGRGAWLAVTGSIPHPHQPLNKATQQDCFSSLMVGQPCNFCLIGLGVCDISTNSYRKLMYHQHVWNYPQLW